MAAPTSSAPDRRRHAPRGDEASSSIRREPPSRSADRDSRGPLPEADRGGDDPGNGPPGGREGGGGGAPEDPVRVAIVSFGPLSVWRRVGWSLAIVGVLVGVVAVAVLVPSASIPLLLAFLIAYLLAPIVDKFERWGVYRTLAIAALVLAFVGLIAGGVALIVPVVADDLASLPDRIARAVERGSAWIERTFGVQTPATASGVQEAVTRRLSDGGGGGSTVGGFVQGLYGQTVGALGMIAGLALVPVFAFFLLRDMPRMIAWVRGLVPARHRDSFSAYFRRFDGVLAGFVRGQLVVSLILAVLYSLGLWLVGLPLAILVGIIAGLGNMIPYFGTAVGLVLATIVALFDWQGFVQLALVYGVFALVQVLEGWLITPKIVGIRVGLSPFAVIVAVLVFGGLFGFLGILLAVPIAAVLKILLGALVDSYQHSALFDHRRSRP